MFLNLLRRVAVERKLCSKRGGDSMDSCEQHFAVCRWHDITGCIKMRNLVTKWTARYNSFVWSNRLWHRSVLQTTVLCSQAAIMLKAFSTKKSFIHQLGSCWGGKTKLIIKCRMFHFVHFCATEIEVINILSGQSSRGLSLTAWILLYKIISVIGEYHRSGLMR